MGYYSDIEDRSDATSPTGPLTLCVLLYALPGQEQGLADYEDLALGRLPAYGAVLRQRVRTTGSDDPSAPLEVQIIEFPSQQALDRFMVDPERVAADDQRRRAIARTDILVVDVIDG